MSISSEKKGIKKKNIEQDFSNTDILKSAYCTDSNNPEELLNFENNHSVPNFYQEFAATLKQNKENHSTFIHPNSSLDCETICTLKEKRKHKKNVEKTFINNFEIIDSNQISLHCDPGENAKYICSNKHKKRKNSRTMENNVIHIDSIRNKGSLNCSNSEKFSSNPDLAAVIHQTPENNYTSIKSNSCLDSKTVPICKEKHKSKAVKKVQNDNVKIKVNFSEFKPEDNFEYISSGKDKKRKGSKTIQNCVINADSVGDKDSINCGDSEKHQIKKKAKDYSVFNSNSEFAAGIQQKPENQYGLIEPNLGLYREEIFAHKEKRKHKKNKSKDLEKTHSDNIEINKKKQIDFSEFEPEENLDYISSGKSKKGKRNKAIEHSVISSNSIRDKDSTNCGDSEKHIKKKTKGYSVLNSNAKFSTFIHQESKDQCTVNEPNSSFDNETIFTRKEQRKHKKNKNKDDGNTHSDGVEINKNKQTNFSECEPEENLDNISSVQSKKRKKNKAIEHTVISTNGIGDKHNTNCGDSEKHLKKKAEGCSVLNSNAEFSTFIHQESKNQCTVNEPNSSFDSVTIITHKEQRKHKKNKNKDVENTHSDSVEINKNKQTNFSEFEPENIFEYILSGKDKKRNKSKNFENCVISADSVKEKYSISCGNSEKHHKKKAKGYSVFNSNTEFSAVVHPKPENQYGLIEPSSSLRSETVLPHQEKRKHKKSKDKDLEKTQGLLSKGSLSDAVFSADIHPKPKIQSDVIKPNSAFDSETIFTHKEKRKHKKNKSKDVEETHSDNAEIDKKKETNFSEFEYVYSGKDKKNKRSKTNGNCIINADSAKEKGSIRCGDSEKHCIKEKAMDYSVFNSNAEISSVIHQKPENHCAVFETNSGFDCETIFTHKQKRKHKKNKNKDVEKTHYDNVEFNGSNQISLSQCQPEPHFEYISSGKKKKRKRSKTIENSVITTDSVTSMDSIICCDSETLPSEKRVRDCSVLDSNAEFSGIINQKHENLNNLITPSLDNETKKNRKKRSNDKEKIENTMNNVETNENHQSNLLQCDSNRNCEFISIISHDNKRKKNKTTKDVINGFTKMNISRKKSFDNPGKSLQNSFDNIQRDNHHSLNTTKIDFIEDPVDFEIPPLHKCETVCNFSVNQKDELLSQRISIKQGKFTPAEDKIIVKNFKTFTKKYNVLDPFELLGIGSYNRNTDMIKFLKAKHFYVHLGRGLNDRSLQSIYKRARNILHPYKSLDQSKIDPVTSLDWLHKTIGNKWQKMADTLGRSADNCLQTHRWHEKVSVKGKWTDEEDANLMKAIQKVTGCSDTSNINVKNISWDKVAAHVPTRNTSQCRWHWLQNLALKSNSCLQKWSKACCEKLIDILRRDWNVEHATEIDWRKVYKYFENVAPSHEYLQKKWFCLKYRIPGYKTMNYRDILRHLCIMYNIDRT